MRICQIVNLLHSGYKDFELVTNVLSTLNPSDTTIRLGKAPPADGHLQLPSWLWPILLAFSPVLLQNPVVTDETAIAGGGKTRPCV